MLSLFHMIEQLNFVAVFWSNLALSAECESFPDCDDDPARAERLRDIALMAGYRLCVEADAWKLVCAERNVEPDGLLRELRGFETIRQAEESARLTLWTADEAAAYLKETGAKEGDLPTVECAAQSMRKFIDGGGPLMDGALNHVGPLSLKRKEFERKGFR